MASRRRRKRTWIVLVMTTLMCSSLLAIPVLGSGMGSTREDQRVDGIAITDRYDHIQGDQPPGEERRSNENQESQKEDEFSSPDSNITGPVYLENVTVDSLDGLSAVEKRAWAFFRLETVEPSDRKAERELADAHEEVNKSISTHVDRVRVGEPGPFGHDRKALQSLRHVDSADTVYNVSTALVSADRETAARSIDDAEYVLDRFEDDIEAPGQRRKAEQHIENAYQALERGDEHASEERSTLQEERSAIKQYEQAWKHAEKATETVHDEVGLSISVGADQHVPHEETITYPIDGELIAPAATVDTVELFVDDERYDTVDVETSAAPGTPGQFETELELATTTANVTVVATDETTNEEVSETIALEAPGFSDETYDIELEDPESGATVTVTGEGIVESDFDIDHVPAETNRSFHAEPFIHLRNYTDFERATVELPLADHVDPEDGELAVYKWDQHDEEPWRQVETDIEDGVATVEVDSFSWFSVFWVDNGNDIVSVTAPLEERHIDETGEGTIEPIEVSLVIDVSGSMRGDRIRNAKAASKRFVGSMYEDDSVGLVSFASGSTLEQSLTTDHESVNDSIDQLSVGGATNTGAGLQEAVDDLAQNGEAEEQSIILLADGGTNRGDDPVEIAEEAAEEGITITTIGVGTGIDARELTDIAEATGGDFYQVEDSDDLPEVFDRVKEERVPLVDSDGDGLPDVIEEADLSIPVGGPTMVGDSLRLDPHDEDTAEDGRLDGDVVDIEWVAYEEDGQPMITAKVVDTIFHPDTGDRVTNEVIKIGYFLPTEADPETEDPVTSAIIDRASGEGYAIAPADDDIPDDRWRHDWWWKLDSDPNWLPDDVVDSEMYHMQLEPVVVVQHTHDVESSDLPDDYEIGFSDSSVRVYDESGEFSYDDGHTQTELVVAAPSGIDDGVSTAYSSIGRSELTVDMTDTDLGREVTVRSEERYIYDTDAAERYEQVYNEGWTVFQEGMTAAASLSTASTKWSAMRAADSMTQKNLIRAIDNADKLLEVVDGESETGYNDMQSDIYDEFGVNDDTVVVGTGPVVAIDLTDDELLED